MRYGKLNSAPSFIDPHLSFSSASASDSPYPHRHRRSSRRRYDAGEEGAGEEVSGEEDLYEDDEEEEEYAATPDADGEQDLEDGEADEEAERRRRSSLSPVIFHSDPIHSRQLSPRGLEESVSTLRPSRGGDPASAGVGSQGAGDSGFRHLFHTAGPSVPLGASYGSTSSQRTTSPHDRDPDPRERETTPKARAELPLTPKRGAGERTPLLDPAGAASPGSPNTPTTRRESTPNTGRRRSSTTRRKKRKDSGVVRGESTDGQTVCLSTETANG